MSELISLAKTRGVWKSLATLKPKEVTKFEIQPCEREWKPAIREGLLQMNLFETGRSQYSRESEIVRKLPYKYYYHVLTEGDKHPRRMMIEDWEIGALYWKCLARTEGDEVAANELVRQKFEVELLAKDLIPVCWYNQGESHQGTQSVSDCRSFLSAHHPTTTL